MTTSSVSPVTTELAGSETGITLIIHAGAGSRGKHSTPERIAEVELDLQRASMPDTSCWNPERRRMRLWSPPSTSWKTLPNSTPAVVPP